MKKILLLLFLVFLLVSQIYGLEIQWEDTLGTRSSHQYIVETDDHGLFHLGVISDEGIYNIAVTRYGSDREIIWQRTYLTQDEAPIHFKILRSLSGNYVLMECMMNRDYYYFLEISDEGDSLSFMRSVTEGCQVNPKDVIVSSTGNYLVLVGVEPFGEDEEWRIHEYNPEFELVEDHFIHRPFAGMELRRIIEVEEEEYLVLGRAHPVINGQGRGVRVNLKFNADFDNLWIKYWGHRSFLGVDGVIELEENRYYVWGNRLRDSSYISIIDREGTVYPDSLHWEWMTEKEEIIPFGEENLLHSFRFLIGDEIPDTLHCGTVITLYNFDLDSLESMLWYWGDYPEYFDDIIPTYDGGALIATQRSIQDRPGRFRPYDYLIKIAPLDWDPDQTVENDQYLPTQFQVIQAYPNPFNSQLTLEFFHIPKPPLLVLMYNTQGQLIDHLEFQSESNRTRIIWTPSDIPSGTYFIRITEPMSSTFIPVHFLR